MSLLLFLHLFPIFLTTLQELPLGVVHLTRTSCELGFLGIVDHIVEFVGLVSIVRYPIMDPNFLIQNHQTLDLHMLVIFRIHPHSSKSQPEIAELVEDSMTSCSSSQSFCNFPTLEKLVLAFGALLSLPLWNGMNLSGNSIP